MSQAVGIVSKIKISETAYKKFIKQEATTFAEELFISFWHKSATIYKLNYNKKGATLYVYAYYHYGSSETLQESLFYQAITKITPFLEADSVGYCFTTLDCLNFCNFEVQVQIQNGVWQQHEFTTAELDAIYKETQKQFFNKIEDVTDYTEFFNTNRSFLDKTVLKQFELLREEARIKTVKEQLHLATNLEPLQLFKGYFYNGTKFYHCDGRDAITYFENCNLQDLVETTYGLTDGNFIIIGNKQLIADPKTFKKLHKFYTTFYVTATEVYDEQLNEIKEADAKTFKLATYKRDISNVYYGEDVNHIYFLGKTICKEALGTFSFSNSLFYDEVLLIGTKKIYLGGTLLEDIDAPSFEKLRLENNAIYEIGKNTIAEETTYAGSMKAFISYGKDKNGEFFLFKPYVNAAEWCFVATSFGFKNNEVVVLRKNEAEFLEFYEKYKREVAANALPFLNSILPENNLDSAAYFTQFQAFFESKHFDKLLEENKYVPDFLTKFNNYLHHCWQLYINTRDKNYLTTSLTHYKKIESQFIGELNPFIFHHLACFSVDLNQLDEAVNYVLKAFYYGYLQFHLMLNDEDLQPIFNNEKFLEIKNWYETNIPTPYKENQDWRWHPNYTQFPYFNAFNVKLLEELPNEIKKGTKHNYNQIDYVSYIMKNYFIWDFLEEKDENSKAYNKLISTFAPFFNSYLQNTMDLSWQEHCAYHFYRDYAITNAKSHLVRLEYLFFNAHNEYGFNEINEENISDLVNRIHLKYQDASDADKGYIANSKVLEVLNVKLK